MHKFSTILPNYASIVREKQNNGHQILFISPIRSSYQIISTTARKPDHTSKTFHGWAELDSHTDTAVAGRNFTVLHHTEWSFDVSPFSDTYDQMKYFDIVSSATGFTSVTGWKYILVFHEALYMPELDHTLINPNQLRQFHTQVQENPYHATEPMNITNPIRDFIACLESQGKNIPQHLVSNLDRTSRILTYRIDSTPTVESTSNWVPLNKILCEGGNWGAECVYYWHQITSINWRRWTSNHIWGGHHEFQPNTGG